MQSQRKPGARGSILLTGASGFVGRHMAKLLLEQGYRVTALDRETPLDLIEGVEFHQADLLDPASLADLPRTWTGVIHLAGASIPSLFVTIDPVIFNLKVTLNLLNHLVDSKVILVSSCHVYAPSLLKRKESDPVRPQGFYGLSKHLVEQVAPHYHGRLDIRIARPFNHLGPGLRPELMVPSLLQRLAKLNPEDDAPLMMDGLNSTRDFIDVRDVASAYLAILELDAPDDNIFNVCTGVGHSIDQVVGTAMDLLGRRKLICFKERPNSTDDIPYLVGDPAKLRQIGSWAASHSLADSLSSMISSYNFPH